MPGMKVLASISSTTLREIGPGEGMNSTVYLADEPQLGGRVAIKEIPKTSFGSTPGDYFAEAQAMFRTPHPNVVPIQYACETGTHISLAMPFYPRGSLAKRIKDGPLGLREFLRMVDGVLTGLARIHLAGFAHFDLKPTNVFFSDANVPMIADFGQARSISPTGIVHAPRMYLRAFPPEVHTTGVGTVLSDIYQAGLLSYRALNGDPLYRAQVPADAVLEAKIVAGKFPDRQLFMPHVPKRLRTLVRQALFVDPTRRFPNATAMQRAFRRVRIDLDWQTEPLSHGGYRWTAARPGYADIVVELTPDGAAWKVETFTQKAGEPRRAKDRAANWRSGLGRAAADAHLKQVFERLP